MKSSWKPLHLIQVNYNILELSLNLPFRDNRRILLSSFNSKNCVNPSWPDPDIPLYYIEYISRSLFANVECGLEWSKVMLKCVKVFTSYNMQLKQRQSSPASLLDNRVLWWWVGPGTHGHSSLSFSSHLVNHRVRPGARLGPGCEDVDVVVVLWGQSGQWGQWEPRPPTHTRCRLSPQYCLCSVAVTTGRRKSSKLRSRQSWVVGQRSWSSTVGCSHERQAEVRIKLVLDLLCSLAWAGWLSHSPDFPPVYSADYKLGQTDPKYEVYHQISTQHPPHLL